MNCSLSPAVQLLTVGRTQTTRDIPIACYEDYVHDLKDFQILLTLCQTRDQDSAPKGSHL